MSTMTCLSLDQSLLEFVAERLQKIQADSQDTYLKTMVVLPTRRAVKELKKSLLLQTKNNASLFPKIMAVNDFDVLEHSLSLSETKRKGLVLKLLEDSNEGASPEVTTLLMSLLDDVNTYEADIGKLHEIVPEIYAEHWQITSQFLKDFFEKWQGVLSQNQAIEKSQQTILNLKNQVAEWAKNPPEFPVILAGLDGFIPAVKNMMICVEKFPQGEVILNGYLPPLEDEMISETHPNFLLDSFVNPQEYPHNSRAHLISHMMSDKAFEERDVSKISFEDVHLLEADTLDQEAQSIALLARQNLEDPSKTTAIITPDQALAEKIQQALYRWHIRVDLAGGMPLSKTPLGRFILGALNLQAPQNEAVTFLSTLKSPFAFLGYDTPYDLKKQVRRFEEISLRSDPDRVIDLDENLTELMSRFDEATSDFFTLKMAVHQPLDIWLKAHIRLLEKLNPFLWESESGKTAATCFRDLLQNAAHYPELSLKDYQDLLRSSFAGETVREAVNHPRLKILSPIQGAYSPYDCAILCGLNEGVWPKNSDVNPWLNRDMSLALGLPDSQVLIGRAASLLAQNMTAPEIVLSYAKRRGSEPASASRWVLRLKALAQKMNSEKLLLLDDPLVEWGRLLDKPAQKITLQPPQSTPPLESRPKRLSISDVERFFKDPYQIYAKHILKIKPLNALNEPFGPADFGTWIHKVLEQSVLQGQPVEALTETYIPQKMPPETMFLWMKSFDEIKGFINAYLKNQKEKSLETFVEKKLTTIFDIQGVFYELVGKADRIDRLMDGTYEVIDYKTGSTPSKKSLESGDAPQLPLLAYLFEKNTPHAHVSKLTYVNLNTQKIQSFKREKMVENTVERLLQTLEYYHQEDHAYEVNPLESLQDRFNLYGHLERTPEWLEQGGADA